jgi:hypothetical protein
MEEMKPVEMRSGPSAVIDFLRAYLEAPNDADLEIRLGETMAGGPMSREFIL